MAGQAVTCPFCRTGVVVPPAPPPPAPPPEPLSLDDPQEEAAAAEEAAAEERRTRARRAAREAKQRRTALTYLILGPIVAVLALVCAVILAPMMAGDARGVRPITSSELLEVKDPKAMPSPWVAYTPDQPVVETGMGIETKLRRKNSKGTKTRFVLVPVKDKWMIAELEMRAKADRIEGELGKWDTGGPSQEASEKIKTQHPDKKDKLLPVQLDAASGDSNSRLIIMTVGLAFLALLGVGGTIYGFVTLPRKRRR
jgi:hypothetical protein